MIALHRCTINIMSSWRDNLVDKIKQLLADRDIFTVVLLILVATASFGLGRQSIIESNTEQTATVQAATEKSGVVENTINEDIYYVASKNGAAYHLPFCSGAKRISEKNKITFQSKEEAEAAGYRPAANCPGL